MARPAVEQNRSWPFAAPRPHTAEQRDGDRRADAPTFPQRPGWQLVRGRLSGWYYRRAR